MVWVFLSIIVTAVLFGILGKRGNMWRINSRQWLSLFGLLLLIGSCIISIPTGHTGILTTFGYVEDQTLEAGVHFKLPYQEVIVMDNRNQKATLSLSCFSKDIQEVEVNYSINYQINKENAQNIYKDIGESYYQVVMEPRILNAVKTVTAKYTAEALIESRSLMAEEIQQILVEELAAYNIQVLDTAVENMDFSDAFTNAVESKQVAAQNKLQAEIEQAQKTMEEEAEAQRAQIKAAASAEVAKIQAEADLQVSKIQADAAEYAGKKDAAKNEALAQSLTEQLLRYYAITAWDGKLPTYYMGDGTNVLPILGDINTTK